MGACSSKPKTTEFEGSALLSTQTEEVAADQPQAIERSLETPVDEPGKEVVAKAGEDGGGDAREATEAPETEGELDAVKDERHVPLATSSSAGMNLDSSEERETLKIDASRAVVSKEAGAGVNDVGNTVADKSSADDKGVGNSAVMGKVYAEEKGTEDKAAESAIKESKTCDEEAAMSKRAETETDMDSSDKRSIVIPKEVDSSVLDESPAIESPIVGVVQAVDPVKEEGSSESVHPEPEKDTAVAKVDGVIVGDPELLHEGLPTGIGDEEAPASVQAVDMHVTLDPKADVVEPAPSEIIGASGIEMLTPAECNTLKDFDESTQQPNVEGASDEVDSATPAITDSQVDLKERVKDLEPSIPLDDESDVTAEIPTGEDTSNDLRKEAPKMYEAIDPKAAMTEQEGEEKREENVRESNEPTTLDSDVTNGQTKNLVFEDTDMSSGEPSTSASADSTEDGKPNEPVVETMSETEKKPEEVPSMTPEAENDDVERSQVERTASGDIAFEDALDTPLKLEASKPLEEGQVPS